MQHPIYLESQGAESLKPDKAYLAYWIWLLIAPVPVHCFSITFNNKTTEKYMHKCLLGFQVLKGIGSKTTE